MKKTLISLLAILALAFAVAFAQDQDQPKPKTSAKASHSSKAATSADKDDKDKDKDKDKAASSEKLDINTASKEQLEALPGIGPATSQKIIDGRPYRAKSDLVKKKIVGQKEYDKIRDDIIAHQAMASKEKKPASPKK